MGDVVPGISAGTNSYVKLPHLPLDFWLVTGMLSADPHMQRTRLGVNGDRVRFGI